MKQLTTEEFNRKKANSQFNYTTPYFVILGLTHLDYQRGQHWKDRIQSLLKESQIPLFYVKHFYFPDYYTRNPNTVIIFTLNKWIALHSKRKVQFCLRKNKYSPHIVCF